MTSRVLTRCSPWLLLAIFWTLVLAPVALGEGKTEIPSPYSEAVRLGLQEFEDRNFAEARAHFVRAHALAPSARTLRALGMVEFELKHYAERAPVCSRRRSARARSHSRQTSAHAQELLGKAEAYIGTLTLDIAADTAVVVDGVTTNIGAGHQLVLEVGDHTLEFSAPRHIAQKRALTIRGGERNTLRIALVPLESPRETKATRPQEPAQVSGSGAKAPREGRALKSPWLWAAVGLVVAGAATGAVIALRRDDNGTKMREPYTGTGGAPALCTPR